MTDVPAAPADRVVDDDETDSCLCGIPFDEIDAVDDVDLPASCGGVVVIEQTTNDDNDAGGNDVEIGEAEATPDEELPPATGGVAAEGR